MSEFQKWDGASHPVIKRVDDWNNLLDHGLIKPAAFTVWKNGSYYEAVNGSTGKVTYGGAGNAGGTSGTAPHSVITAVITGAAGGRVHLKGADYALTDEIVVGQSSTWVTGDGLDTKLTQATADKDCFTIATKTNVRLSNMYLYGTGADTGKGIDATTTCTGLKIINCKIENWGTIGVEVDNSDYIILFDNIITGNITDGVDLDTCDYARVLANDISINTGHGLSMDDCSHAQVLGNIINGNDLADAATYDGIFLKHSGATCDYNIIENNTLLGNDRYEVNISTATCIGNSVKNNSLDAAADHEKIISDIGTKTEFNVHPLSFVAGGDLDGTSLWANFISATASAKGWKIDDAADFATALGQLPSAVHEIVRFKIWGVALGAPIGGGGQMHLEINMNAGASNLAYTTEPVALADFDGEEADYVNGDVVSWYVDSGDDADIGSMVGGMSVEVEAIYETGAAPDGATNVVLRNIEIEYV